MTAIAPISPAIQGISLTSSENVLGPNTMLSWLVWAFSGAGKTHLAGQLDDLTQKYLGKRTLFIPLEEADGGGIATIRKRNVPMYVPKDLSDLQKLLATLRNDKTIGGVVLDSATELAKAYVRPTALRYPPKENFATREAGVPTRSDYQVMGELMSQLLRQLMLLTKHSNPEYRKHIIVTAADQTREEDDKVVWMGPELPGRMGREAVQMFQQVGTLRVKTKVVDGKRQVVRALTFAGDGVLAVKDRYDIFPPEMEIQKGPGDAGESITSIYEKYWLPNVARGGAAV